MGVEESKVVLAVRVSPKIALPVIETVPDRVAEVVEYEDGWLAGEAKCVAVSAFRALNSY